MASGFNSRWSSNCSPYGRIAASTAEKDFAFKVLSIELKPISFAETSSFMKNTKLFSF